MSDETSCSPRALAKKKQRPQLQVRASIAITLTACQFLGSATACQFLGSATACQFLGSATAWAQSAPEANGAPGAAAPVSPMPEAPAAVADSMDSAARSHFQLGRAFYDAGRFGEASDEFSEAYRLSKRPELLYNVYVASRDAGKLETAVEALRNYLSKVEDAPDSVNLHARLQALEAQLAQRDAEARARDEKIAEANARADALRMRTERVPSVVPWILIGSGAAAGVAAAVTGGLALGKHAKLKDDCVSSVCRQSSASDIHTLKVLSVSTDVLIGAGSAAVITGLVLLWTHALDGEREVPYVSAFAGPHQVGSTFTTRF